MNKIKLYLYISNVIITVSLFFFALIYNFDSYMSIVLFIIVIILVNSFYEYSSIVCKYKMYYDFNIGFNNIPKHIKILFIILIFKITYYLILIGSFLMLIMIFESLYIQSILTVIYLIYILIGLHNFMIIYIVLVSNNTNNISGFNIIKKCYGVIDYLPTLIKIRFKRLFFPLSNNKELEFNKMKLMIEKIK